MLDSFFKKVFKKSSYFLEETKKSALLRFLAILGVIISYFFFASYKYGASHGLLVTFLTWSMFVLCTPIADAGFILDFPMRLLTDIRMLYSEVLVWLIVIVSNLFLMIFNPSVYDTTVLLGLFKFILNHPFPFWAIIIISGLGTFLSVIFGDELMDVASHEERHLLKRLKPKYKIILLIFGFAIVVSLYWFLLHELNIQLF